MKIYVYPVCGAPTWENYDECPYACDICGCLVVPLASPFEEVE